MKRHGKRIGLLFVVSAPSGTGKTTLCRAMTNIFPDLHYSISYTTRSTRPGDKNGRDYHFISAKEFQKLIDSNDLAEWAEIYGYRYGTSRSVLKRTRQEGRDVILDIDGQGARQLRNQDLQGIFILILPPSLAVLKERLSKRKTEGKAQLKERLKKAKAEMADARWYDYMIINDELKKAKEHLKAIILAEHCQRERMEGFLKDLIGVK